MRLVIADSGPINYLVLIGEVHQLPRLFERMILPSAVHFELSNKDAPLEVQAWIENPPAWLKIVDAPLVGNVPGIHRGEASAIALATSMRADLLLMDDRKGVRHAREQGLRVTGTLGVLDLAASRGFLDFQRALTALESTNFRMPLGLMAMLRDKHQERG